MDMPRKYKRLTSEERYAVGIMLAEGHTRREIARALGREPSTISRELKRGAADSFGAYQSDASHAQTILRRSDSRKRPRLKTPTIRAYVEAKLNKPPVTEQRVYSGMIFNGSAGGGTGDRPL